MQTVSTSYQVCVPKTSDHRRAMKWFSALTRAIEDGTPATPVEPEQADDDRMSLQHSVQLFSVFIETGDKRYLELCEDFLKYSLVSNAPAAAKR